MTFKQKSKTEEQIQELQEPVFEAVSVYFDNLYISEYEPNDFRGFGAAAYDETNDCVLIVQGFQCAKEHANRVHELLLEMAEKVSAVIDIDTPPDISEVINKTTVKH